MRRKSWPKFSAEAHSNSAAFDDLPLIELSDPDIPKTDWLAPVTVRLKLNGSRCVFLVKRLPDIQRLAL